jgi:hypothetical protein
MSVLFNGQMTDKEKTVFYLQLYQLLRLHLIIKYKGFPTTTSAYATFASYHSYLIQDLKFNIQTLANILWTGFFLKQKTSTKKLAGFSPFLVLLSFLFILSLFSSVRDA